MKYKFKHNEGYCKIYENAKGDIRVVYPKAPKWAQEVAVQIWKDADKNGFPTKKGVKDIVRGLWAKMIAEAH